MREMIEKGRFAWIGGGRNLTAITHVDNVVEGLVLGAERGTPGEVYFVTDGDPVVLREFVTEMLATKGVVPPDRSLPGALAGPMAAISEAAWKALPLPGAPPLSRFTAWVMTQECTIDISKARARARLRAGGQPRAGSGRDARRGLTGPRRPNATFRVHWSPKVAFAPAVA